MWITGAESETCKLFSFRRGLFRINVSYDKESRYVFLFQSTALEFSHCYRCFGGCYSTGTDSEAFRLFWKKLGNALTLQLNLKHKKLFCAGLEAIALLELNLSMEALLERKKGCGFTRIKSGAWGFISEGLETVALL
uniref:Uncharacterized protein n=1 Tax=Strongyloides stercoralis TaxID=6248 RepID=A0A0K0E5P9_STRER